MGLKTSVYYIGLVALMAGLLSACSKFEADSNPSDPSQGVPTTTISMAATTTSTMEILQQNPDPDLLKGKTNFHITANSPSVIAHAFASLKKGTNYIVYYNEGSRQTSSPDAQAMKLGCSIYSPIKLTERDFSVGLRSVIGQNKAMRTQQGVAVHFTMDVQGKKINLQCFKALASQQNAFFTLNDLSRALGADFKVKKSLAVADINNEKI